MRDFHLGQGLIGDPNLLTSQVYLEGFGEGAYSRLDIAFYQGLDTPSSTPARCRLCCRAISTAISACRIARAAGSRSMPARSTSIRTDGTNTRRASLTHGLGAAVRRPARRPVEGHVARRRRRLRRDRHFNQQPNFGTARQCRCGARAAAGGGRFPLAVLPRRRRLGHPADRADRPVDRRPAAPATASSTAIPNEDSLDFEFTDANLFGFNRFPGIDRLEGGVRANVLCMAPGTWAARSFDGLIGQSYRTDEGQSVPASSRGCTTRSPTSSPAPPSRRPTGWT